MKDRISTPVALMIYNRPEREERVFAEIAKARPPKLLVVADGPRPDDPEDERKCDRARSIIDRVDWDCEVLKNYSPDHLGCRKRFSSGLDWVFENVEEAIVLEDDCLPHPTFFHFCEELLMKYRDDERVMMVCGENPLGTWKEDSQSYHFSVHASIWGWASWRRAWKYYDVDMKLWAIGDIQKKVRDVIGDADQYRMRKTHQLDVVYNREIDDWHIQLLLACYLQSGLSVYPAVNLISNIGFGAGATNTHDPDHNSANRSTQSMAFPLQAPYGVVADRSFDRECHSQIIRDNDLRESEAA